MSIKYGDTVRVKSGFYKGLEGKPSACVRFFLWFPEYLLGNNWFYSYQLEIIELAKIADHKTNKGE